MLRVLYQNVWIEMIRNNAMMWLFLASTLAMIDRETLVVVGFFLFQMSSPINYYFQFIFVSFSFFLFHCIIIFTHFKPIGNFSFDTCSFQSHFLFGLFFHERAIQSMEYQNGFCFCKKNNNSCTCKNQWFVWGCLFVCLFWVFLLLITTRQRKKKIVQAERKKLHIKIRSPLYSSSQTER